MNSYIFFPLAKIKSKEKELELSLAIRDSKTFNAYVTLPKIEEEIPNENYLCNFTEKFKSEDDEWDEIIANLKSRLENCDKSSSEKLKPEIRHSVELDLKNESADEQEEDFVYKFHEVQYCKFLQVL